MDYLKAIYQQNKRILEALEERKQWVKWPAIQRMTGWKKEEFRIKRENGSVKWKKDKNGIWYDADSVMEIDKIKIESA